MKLVKTDNNILYRETEPFDFTNPPIDPVELTLKMIELMKEQKAVGLAANQIGLPYKMFVIEGSPPVAFFNPKIVATSEDMTKLVEGCLTFPDLWLEIERPDWVRIRFQLPDGSTETKMFGGYHARVILHEYDHLIGKVFTWKVSPRDLTKAQKKAKLVQEARASGRLIKDNDYVKA